MQIVLKSAPLLGRRETIEHHARMEDISIKFGKDKNRAKMTFETVQNKFISSDDFKNAKFISYHICVLYKTRQR